MEALAPVLAVSLLRFDGSAPPSRSRNVIGSRMAGARRAADLHGYPPDAGPDRSRAYLGVRRLDSSGTWGGGSAEMLAMPSICQGCCRSWPYLSVCAAGRDLPGPRIAGCWDGRIGV